MYIYIYTALLKCLEGSGKKKKMFLKRLGGSEKIHVCCTFAVSKLQSKETPFAAYKAGPFVEELVVGRKGGEGGD